MIVLLGPNGAGKSTYAKKLGGFLCYQFPVSVPGVSYFALLHLAYKQKISVLKFRDLLLERAKIININPAFFEKDLNTNLSGGEKKKMELFQALVLLPKFVILDEPDSGIDVDSQKDIVAGIKYLQKQKTDILLITHSTTLLRQLNIEGVKIMINNKIAAEGGIELVREVEKNGFKKFSH